MPHPEDKSHCPLDHGWVFHMWGILGRREISSPSRAYPWFFLEEVPIKQTEHHSNCFAKGDQFYLRAVRCHRFHLTAGGRRRRLDTLRFPIYL